MALLAAEGGLLWWLGSVHHRWSLDGWWLRSPPTPLVARLVFAAAFAAAVWRTWPDFKPIPVGNAGAIATFFVAAEWASDSGIYALFVAASGLILVVSLLQEPHQLPFPDPPTPLPARRPLHTRLPTLCATNAPPIDP